MSNIHSTSTKPEVKLMKELWWNGFRYRKNDKRFPGSPDIVLPKYQTVVFVHGCFWHGHKGCKYYTIPKTNTDFWVEKVARNQKRDECVWRQLEAMGWAVIIVWECELKKKAFESTVDRVIEQIKINGDRFEQLKTERVFLREQRKRDKLEQEQRYRSILNEVK